MPTRSGVSDPFTGNVLSSFLVEYCVHGDLALFLSCIQI